MAAPHWVALVAVWLYPVMVVGHWAGLMVVEEVLAIGVGEMLAVL